MKSRESLKSTLKIYVQLNENIDEMGKFLDTYNHPKLNQENINHLNRNWCNNKDPLYKEEPRTS
jgi:hypothetical protein